MVAVDTRISRCRFEAQIQEVLVESEVPGKRCLLETIEGADETADVVWMLLALETFSLRNVEVLVEECLKKGIFSPYCLVGAIMLGLEDPACADGLQPRRERTELKGTVEMMESNSCFMAASHSVLADETRTAGAPANES